MRILALDTATRTGYALVASDVISSGVIDCSIRTKATKTIPADHLGKRFYDFQKWLREAIRNTRPDLIVYERVVGGPKAGGKTTLIQKGLEAVVILEAYRGGDQPIPLWTFAAATIKKWGINSGLLTHDSKIVMTKMAFNKFTDQDWIMTDHGPDNNQADALWILDLARTIAQEFHSCYTPDTLDVEDAELTRLAGIVTSKKWSQEKHQ